MNYIGEIISLFTAFFWTATVICFESAGRKVGSLSVNFIRLLFGFSFIAITVFLITGSLFFNEPLEVWNFFLISGLIGFVIGDFFLFQSFIDIGGRISLLILSSVPIISSILGFIIYQEVLSTMQMVGVIIIVISISFVILSKQEEQVIHPHTKRGILFAFIGAFAQAIGLVLSKEGMSLMTVTNDTAKALIGTEIRIISAMIGFILIITFRKEWSNIKVALHNKKAMMFIIAGSFFGPFLGVTSQLLAVRYTTLGIHTTISQLNVIMIIPFSIFIFKDKVNIREIIGSIAAFIGVMLLFI